MAARSGRRDNKLGRVLISQSSSPSPDSRDPETPESRESVFPSNSCGIWRLHVNCMSMHAGGVMVGVASCSTHFPLSSHVLVMLSKFDKSGGILPWFPLTQDDHERGARVCAASWLLAAALGLPTPPLGSLVG